ncbi:MAG: SH3 domain-containing protein [Zoogloeaceae bacterium]|jgi:SH3-like domain-containing protein|nr:SH3 domain-containing protein [Zoogloeaceae bacterium]
MSRLSFALLMTAFTATASLFGNAAHALEYRSVAVPVAIFYDAPSTQGRKLYLTKAGAPLEVIAKMKDWVKVRDAEGTIAWIQESAVSSERTLVVTADLADVRQAANETAAIVFQAEKWVSLELLEGAPAGWAKVKHRDGASGFVRITQIWGL